MQITYALQSGNTNAITEIRGGVFLGRFVLEICLVRSKSDQPTACLVNTVRFWEIALQNVLWACATVKMPKMACPEMCRVLYYFLFFLEMNVTLGRFLRVNTCLFKNYNHARRGREIENIIL